METTQTLPQVKAPARRTVFQPERFFYTGSSVLLLILMLLGFQLFYLHGRAFPDRPLAPPILPLILVHGITMTLWFILAVIQPWLIIQRKTRIHKRLGMAGAALAALIVISGLKLGIEASQLPPPDARIWGMSFKQFLIVPTVTVLVFGAFVAIGVVNRKKPAIHRPMMFLASLAAVGAATDRIPFITGLYNTSFLGSILGPFAAVVLLGLILLIVKSVLTRSFDRVFATGWATISLIGLISMAIAPTPVWDGIANFMYRF